jgi:cell wall-associated NlpC family hydrolase
MRPSSGPGSDCSDLMNTALARLLGLASGDLTPEQVLDSIEEAGA